jgi:hypothetical protein
VGIRFSLSPYQPLELKRPGKWLLYINKRREGADEEEAGTGGVLRASGAGAENTEGKDGKDDDEVGETGDAGGVLRASGADADGLENKYRQDGDDDDDVSERRCDTDGRGGEPGAVTCR